MQHVHPRWSLRCCWACRHGLPVAGKTARELRTSSSLCSCHQKSGSIRNTIVREVEIQRGNAAKLGKSAMNGIPVRSIAFTRAEYNGSGDLVGVDRFFMHDGFGVGSSFAVTR